MSTQVRNKKCRLCLFTLLGGVVFLIAMASHFYMTVQKVINGHGFEVFYFTFYSPRYGMTYLSALIYYVIFAVIFALLPIIYWFDTKEERDFKKKYKINE